MSVKTNCTNQCLILTDYFGVCRLEYGEQQPELGDNWIIPKNVFKLTTKNKFYIHECNSETLYFYGHNRKLPILTSDIIANIYSEQMHKIELSANILKLTILCSSQFNKIFTAAYGKQVSGINDEIILRKNTIIRPIFKIQIKFSNDDLVANPKNDIRIMYEPQIIRNDKKNEYNTFKKYIVMETPNNNKCVNCLDFAYSPTCKNKLCGCCCKDMFCIRHGNKNNTIGDGIYCRKEIQNEIKKLLVETQNIPKELVNIMLGYFDPRQYCYYCEKMSTRCVHCYECNIITCGACSKKKHVAYCQKHKSSECKCSSEKIFFCKKCIPNDNDINNSDDDDNDNEDNDDNNNENDNSLTEDSVDDTDDNEDDNNSNEDSVVKTDSNEDSVDETDDNNSLHDDENEDDDNNNDNDVSDNDDNVNDVSDNDDNDDNDNNDDADNNENVINEDNENENNYN
jgi:hypothetical protein